MTVWKKLVCLLALFIFISFSFQQATAQIDQKESASQAVRLENELVVAEGGPVGYSRPAKATLDTVLLDAIHDRLGSSYLYGATGPVSFDCSGFVWSVFQSAGVRFDRGSARYLWSTFLAAEEDQKFEFGTLVFFSNLTHVGIVADENGFYHASRRYGVIYSPFSKYWVGRIDGFRRVPGTTINSEPDRDKSD